MTTQSKAAFRPTVARSRALRAFLRSRRQGVAARRGHSLRFGGLAIVTLLAALWCIDGGQVRAETSRSASGNTVAISTNFYKVTGSTLAEVAASKRESRPWKHEHGFDALTKWTIDWSFRYTFRDGEYRVRAFKTHTRIVVTLPQWTPPPGAESELVERWKRYWKQLAIHERGHVSLAQLAAAEMRKQVGMIDSAESEAALAKMIQDTVDRALATFYRREAAYDEETGHGAKQGAHFP